MTGEILTPSAEIKRLKELYNYELLDTAYESEFDDIVRLASQICDTPISVISLIDLERQWFKAKIGLEGGETSRQHSFCAHAILQEEIFTVTDASTDSRFMFNPLVTGDPNIRFYAGMPLTTRNGYKIGTLCVIDRKPRSLSKEQEFALAVLGSNIMKLIEERMQRKQLKYAHDVQERITSMLAHEVRNPLASLKSIVQLRSSNYLSADESEQLSKSVIGQIDQVLKMLNEFSEWGKDQILAGANNAKAETPYKISEVVNKAIESQAMGASLKEISIHKNAADNIFIDVNRQKLLFIVRNILNNAIKYSNAGVISIEVFEAGSTVTISIADNGVGMNDKQLASILQTDNFTSARGTNNEKGTGLGLLLVKEYMDELGGNMKITSKENVGSTFELTFAMPGASWPQ